MPYVHYPNLFTPLTIAKTTLANRIVMGAMHTGLEDNPQDFTKLVKFYQRRAQAELALIITGGFSPNTAGCLAPNAAKLDNPKQIAVHQQLTQAVHKYASKICLQILHAGRYAMHQSLVAPSAIPSPLHKFMPKALTDIEIQQTIQDYTNTAVLAQQSGYDGIEIMGSEGYLIHQFISPYTNQRQDHWGQTASNRNQFALTIVEQIRQAVGLDFLIIFRLSLIDLLPNQGNQWHETIALAQALQQAGVDAINTGIGWHESRIPTIANIVPEAGFSKITAKLKPYLNIPIITANRINTPELAETILSKNWADAVSMARPLLADPDFVLKAKQNKSKHINICIACNQSCLDQVFVGKQASCLVNPMAGYETKLVSTVTPHPKKIAVIGLGPAGLAFCITASQRGHQLVAFEAKAKIGGQFNLAAKIPGKQVFQQSLDYFRQQLQHPNIQLHLATTPVANELLSQKFDAIVIATGVKPLLPNITGINHANVLSYQQLLTTQPKLQSKIAIMGAGGIGFDVLAYLLKHQWLEAWELDINLRGGLKAKPISTTNQTIYLLQRKTTKLGKDLSKTTGWILRQLLQRPEVIAKTGINYQAINDQGLLIQDQNKNEQQLFLDHIIVCAGQQSVQPFANDFYQQHSAVYSIGGANSVKGLDAAIAIRQGVELGLKI